MEFKSKQAIYLQIADQFLENILQGKWAKGDKIASIRDISVEFEVNPNTTMRTFNFLQEKEIIYNKRGVGYFVSEEGYEKTLLLKREKFFSEELPAFLKTMRLLNIGLEDLQHYMDHLNNPTENENKQ